MTVTHTAADRYVTPVTPTAAGEVVALVAVTGGVPDHHRDVIEAGAFRGVTPREVKMFSHHQWTDEIGRVVGLHELPAGDPRLPRVTASGDPWPAECGGLWARCRYDLAAPAGRRAYAEAKAAGAQQAWSIGYVAGDAKRESSGVRRLRRVRLLEVSQVPAGAHDLARTIEVKGRGGRGATVEVKSTPWWAASASGRESMLFDDDALLDATDLARAARYGLDYGDLTTISTGDQLRARLLVLGVFDEPGLADTLEQFEQLEPADQRVVLERLEREAGEDADAERAAIIDEIAKAARAGRLRAAGLDGGTGESLDDIEAAQVDWRMDAYGSLVDRASTGDGWSGQPPRWP